MCENYTTYCYINMKYLSMKYALLLICAAVLVPASIKAQQISVGPAAGFHFTKYTAKRSGTSVIDLNQKKNVVDWRVGAITDISLSKRFHLQSGLLFTTNTFKYDGEPTQPSVYESFFSMQSLELPVTMTLHTGDKNKGHFFCSGGGFLACNIAGKKIIKSSGAIGLFPGQVATLEEDLKYGSESPADYRRLGTGVLVSAGYQYKSGFSARVHYQRGLRNQFVRPSNDYKMTSSNIGLTLGYLIRVKG